MKTAKVKIVKKDILKDASGVKAHKVAKENNVVTCMLFLQVVRIEMLTNASVATISGKIEPV